MFYYCAQVIFVIGEIDCREGLVIALERDMYQSLHEAMSKTIHIFERVIVNLVKKRHFQVR
jgi:hypothetical protein